MPVLLVEDDIMIRLTLSDFFADTDLDILEAANAEDALALVDESAQDIDILVTDLDLGLGANGLTLAAQLRVRFPDLRVIYATGSPENFAGYAFSPWEQVFLKPFNPMALVATVTTLTAENYSSQRYQPLPVRAESKYLSA